MNQASYILLMFSPLFFVLFLCICLLLWSWYKGKGYMKMLFEFIAMNVFPEILEKKTTEDGKVVTYFDKEKMILRSDELKPKVKRALLWVSSLLIINILQLFGAFLFLKTSSYCDETKDCFLVGGQTSHPVNCEDLKTRNETTALVCYEIVFRLPTAVGLCYGIFKTCTVALTVATTLMMNMDFSPEKIVCNLRWCRTMTAISFAQLIITSLCAVCAFCTLIFYRGPLHGVDWEEVSTLFTVVVTCVLTSIYVCVMPWEELMRHKAFKKEGTPDEREACTTAISVAFPGNPQPQAQQ